MVVCPWYCNRISDAGCERQRQHGPAFGGRRCSSADLRAYGGHCGESSALCDVHATFAEAQVAILARLAEATVADVLATAALEGIHDQDETSGSDEPVP